jgi:tetratricopeptide (TPR) repeat protein
MANGQDLLRAGAYQQAITSFRKVLSRDPNHFEAQYNLALSYLNLQRYGKAVKEFKRAISLNQKNPHSYANIAIAYEAMGNDQEALNSLSSAVRLDPQNINIRMNLATMYMNLDRYDRAIREYREVIAINGRYIEAYTNLAKTLIAKNRIAEAKKYLQEASSVAPNNAETHYQLGNIYWKHDKDTEKALREFRLAVSLESQNPTYYQGLAMLLESMGKTDEAIDTWKKCMVYLNDALTKEKIAARVEQLEQGDQVPVSAQQEAPVTTTKDNIAELQKELRDGEKKEQRIIQTAPVDVSSDLEELENAEDEETIDLREELKRRTGQGEESE